MACSRCLPNFLPSYTRVSQFCAVFASAAQRSQGVSASYLGVAESVIQFTMYEGMKASALSTYIADTYGSGAQHASFFVMGATAKLSASIITYPHEVIRTRLRQVNANKCVHGFTCGLWVCV